MAQNLQIAVLTRLPAWLTDASRTGNSQPPDRQSGTLNTI